MIFLSHSWSKTTGGKNIHDIVSRINNHIKLQEPTWFDEEQIVYDIDGSIVRGITKCSMFVSFLSPLIPVMAFSLEMFLGRYVFDPIELYLLLALALVIIAAAINKVLFQASQSK